MAVRTWVKPAMNSASNVRARPVRAAQSSEGRVVLPEYPVPADQRAQTPE